MAWRRIVSRKPCSSAAFAVAAWLPAARPSKSAALAALRFLRVVIAIAPLSSFRR
jgi:hypothetical protein